MSAKPAPATRPTYPVPMTQIFMASAHSTTAIFDGVNVMLTRGRADRRASARSGWRLPKPLVPICGYPAIRFGLHAAARAGRAARGRQRLPSRRPGAGGPGRRVVSGAGRWIAIAYSVETELLGTGGGLAEGAAAVRRRAGAGHERQGGRRPRPAGAAGGARARAGAVATMLLRDDPEPRRWGAIGVDATGRVVEHPRRAVAAAARGRGDRADVHRRPRAGARRCSIACSRSSRDVIRDAYIPALLAGETITAGHARRLLRRALDARALPGRQPGAAARSVAAARPARAARRRRSGRGDRSGARGSSRPVASKPAPSSRRAPRSVPTWSWARARASRPARASSAPSSGRARSRRGDVADAVVTPERDGRRP